MASISIETKRIDQLAEALAVGSDSDLLLIRLADGTGTKRITVGNLRAALVGDLGDLETEDKSSFVAAINENAGKISTDEEKIAALEELTSFLGINGAGIANAIPIDKSIGESFTAEQSADIRAGKFEKVKTGNHWTINGHKYYAGHADYRLHCGDTELTTHHMLVFPAVAMYNHAMNDTAVTTGGYSGSKMKTEGLDAALAQAKADFGEDHILAYRIYLTNAVTNGRPSGGAWFDSQIDLMNEHMVYGGSFFSPTSDGTTIPTLYDIDKSQLALFQARPDLITTRAHWWLRDVVSAANFAYVAYDGGATYLGASYSLGVRPAFLIY